MPDDENYHSPNHHKYTVDNRLYQHHLHQMMQRTTEMVVGTAPESLLAVGCGEGFVVDYIKRQEPQLKITGVDVSEPAISYAQEHFGNQATFITGSLFDLPFDDDSFDTLLCSEVLEHVPNPGQAAEELRRVAKNAVVITVPREPYFQWLNNLGQWLGLSPDPGHVNFWTKKGFQEFIHGHYPEADFDWKHIYQLAAARV